MVLQPRKASNPMPGRSSSTSSKRPMAEPGFKEYLTKNSQYPEFIGPEEFTAAVRADYEYMGKLLQKVVKN